MSSRKKLISIVTLFLFLSVFIIPVNAVAKTSSAKLKFVVNGNTILSSVPQLLYQGQPMVPLRKVCYAIGAKVSVDNKSKKILCTKYNAKLELPLPAKNIPSSTITKPQDTSVLLLYGKIYIAEQKIEETFGIQVKWDKSKKTVTMNTGPLVFYGDSITEGFPLKKYFSKTNIINKGVNGDSTTRATARLKEITQLKPSKVFIMLGTNDARGNFETDITFGNYNKIIKTIHDECPYTQIFIQSVLPFGQKELDTNPQASNEKINDINIGLKNIATSQHLTFLDIGSLYKDSNGLLNRKYSNDGVHLIIPNYSLWAKKITNSVKI